MKKSRWLATTALGLGLGLAAGVAGASSLQFTVRGADGSPAPDTVVMVQPTARWPQPPPPPTVVIEQKQIRFRPYVSVVPLGGSVRFVNLDNFDHHVRSQAGGPLGSVPPAREFEFRLSPPRKGHHVSPDVAMDVTGGIVIGCHLHNSMRGHIYVSATPWAAVTDEQGRVAIDGAPDGTVDVRLWHPDQLAEQAPQRLQLTGAANAEGKLNFAPRRRTPPRETPETRSEYR